MKPSDSFFSFTAHSVFPGTSEVVNAGRFSRKLYQSVGSMLLVRVGRPMVIELQLLPRVL